jgi:hypothetical protein
MDVGFDEAGQDEPSIEPHFGAVCVQHGLDRRDAPAEDTDVDHRLFAAADARTAKDRIERHSPCSSA